MRNGTRHGADTLRRLDVGHHPIRGYAGGEMAQWRLLATLACLHAVALAEEVIVHLKSVRQAKSQRVAADSAPGSMRPPSRGASRAPRSPPACGTPPPWRGAWPSEVRPSRSEQAFTHLRAGTYVHGVPAPPRPFPTVVPKPVAWQRASDPATERRINDALRTIAAKEHAKRVEAANGEWQVSTATLLPDRAQPNHSGPSRWHWFDGSSRRVATASSATTSRR
jgi:hypothetical protein